MFAPLHAIHQTSFLASWNPDLTILVPLLLLAAGYRFGTLRIRESRLPAVGHGQQVAFYAGLIAIAVALLGPLDSYNGDLFLLHMTQHMVLMLVGAPLLLIGRPLQVGLRAFPPHWSRTIVGRPARPRPVRRILTVLTHPVFVVTLFLSNLAFWHIPRFYEAALLNERVHEIEHVLFLTTSILFWWVIIAPVPRHHKVAPHIGILMLFISGSVGDLIGLTLTFSSRVLYPFYQQAENPWGISPISDQRLAGLIMLASGTLVFFGAIFWLLAETVQDPAQSAAKSNVSESINAPMAEPWSEPRLDDAQRVRSH